MLQAGAKKQGLSLNFEKLRRELRWQKTRRFSRLSRIGRRGASAMAASLADSSVSD
jgi:hypothetical protein